MHDQSTGVLTVDDVIRAHPGPLIEGPAGEWHGACPLCGGKDRWWTRQDGPKLVIQCRQAECGATFPDHLAALGFDVAGAMVPPLMPAAPVPPRETGRWQCVNPVTGQLADHVRIEPGRTGRDKDVIWEPGAKSKEMIWPPTYQPTPGPLIVTEGEKAAQAAVERLGLDAIGTCCGCSATPTLGALKWCEGRDVILSPDNDTGGHVFMARIAVLLKPSAASVRILDAHQLPDAVVVDKWDLADWNPSDSVDVLGAVEAASRNPVDLVPPTEDYRRWRRLSEIEAGESDEPPIVARGLLWRGRLTHLWAEEKLGKSSLLWGALAAVTTGRPWLGEPTTAGAVAVMTEEALDAVATRMKRYGGDPARVFVFEPCKLAEFETGLAELPASPAVVAVDTLRALMTAEKVKETDTGGHINNLVNGLAHAAHRSGAPWCFTHHAQRSGDNYAHSGTIGAAPDMIVGMQAGQDRERVLSYRGRWHQDTLRVVLAADATGYAEATAGEGGHGSDTGGRSCPARRRAARSVTPRSG